MFQVTLFGAGGRSYIIESRTAADSGLWQPIATNTVGPYGVWNFAEQIPTGIAARLYRARQRD